MAKVSLRIYNREIESLIDQNQFDEAIAHCKHILKTFPKHLETYRLLGKTYLELKRYQDAAEIFQRVLLAVPDDFVSHVGMSIIRDDEEKLDEAIWHMERAYDRQSSNAAVQGELQRLYGRRDGAEPKIRMTRGALAHMYVQGELYPQAIGEVRGVLADDPNRQDMQVLLALAYFRNGQKVEASEVCATLLRKYAYCLDANRILLEILPGTGRAENTQIHRQRVNEMDPYAAFVTASVFQSEAVPDAAVNLERLDYDPGQLLDSSSSWPASLESKALSSGTAHEIPEWLKAAEQPAQLEAPSAGTPAEQAPADDALPDFLRTAGWGAATGAAVETASAFDDSPEAEPVQGEAVPADIPEWLKAMAPSEPAPAAPVEAPVSGASEAPEAEDTMDWLKNLGAGKTPAQEPGPEEGKTPAEPEASIGDLGKSDEERDESFLWLESLAAKQGARSDELLTKPEERLDEAPEWVEQAKDLTTGQEAEAQPAESMPDWLKELQPQDAAGEQPGVPAETEAQPADATPDWLKELQPQEAAGEQPGMPAETEAQPADATPDWLKEMKAQETPEELLPAPSAAVPSGPSIGDLGKSDEEQDESFLWLESLAAKQGARSDELLTKPEERLEAAPEWVEQARDAVLPEVAVQPAAEEEAEDWLKSLQPVEEAPGAEDEIPAAVEPSGTRAGKLEEQPAAEPADDMPDWLRAMKAEAQAGEQPAVPVEAEPQSAPAAEPAATGEDVADWLKSLETGETPAEAAEVEPQAVPPAGPPETGTSMADWLKSLEEEEKQAGEAPAAAVEPATSTGGVTDWLKSLETEEAQAGETPPVAAEPEQPATPPTEPAAASEEMPDWLKAMEAEEKPAAELPAAPVQQTPEPAGEQELPEWLREEEPAEPSLQPTSPAEWKPAEPPAYKEPTTQPVQVGKKSVQAPPISQPAASRPPAAPAVSELEATRQTGHTGMLSTPGDPTLRAAQAELNRGNIQNALQEYGKLIKKAKLLDEVIFDLREALYRYPVDVLIWQALGDAYMRSNRLQDALDAYTKAEELLR